MCHLGEIAHRMYHKGGLGRKKICEIIGRDILYFLSFIIKFFYYSSRMLDGLFLYFALEWLFLKDPFKGERWT